MDNNIFLIFFTGVLAGCIHVLTGPDHLSAIAPLAARNPGKAGPSGSGGVWDIPGAYGCWRYLFSC